MQAPGHGADLDAAGALQRMDVGPRLGDGGAAGQRAVIAQDHQILVAEIGAEPRALVHVDRHAFEFVVRHVRSAGQRGLADRQQAVLLRRHRHAVVGVQVDDAVHVGARLMDRAVNDKTRVVERVLRRQQDIAFLIQFEQRRGGDLAETHSVRIDQEVPRFARHTARDMRRDEIGPAVEVDQAITGGEFDAHLPLRSADLLAHSAGFDCCFSLHGTVPPNGRGRTRPRQRLWAGIRHCQAMSRDSLHMVKSPPDQPWPGCDSCHTLPAG